LLHNGLPYLLTYSKGELVYRLGYGIAERAGTFLGSSQFTPLPVLARTDPSSTGTTSIEELLDNPDTRAVLMKEIPGTMANPQLSNMKPYTLLTIASHGPGLNAGILCKIDEELYKTSDSKY
jgi:hypothetical protein